MSTLTTKPKVAVFESIDWENEIFRQELEGFDVQFFSEEIELLKKKEQIISSNQNQKMKPKVKSWFSE